MTSIPGDINCGSNCVASVYSDLAIELFAKAQPNSTFVGWSGACSGTKSCFFIMNEDKFVTATFTKPQRQLSAGTQHTCALRANETVACFGLNRYGESTPPADEFLEVASGRDHSCGLRTDGP